jgi:hypothetical protein
MPYGSKKAKQRPKREMKNQSLNFQNHSPNRRRKFLIPQTQTLLQARAISETLRKSATIFSAANGRARSRRWTPKPTSQRLSKPICSTLPNFPAAKHFPSQIQKS